MYYDDEFDGRNARRPVQVAAARPFPRPPVQAGTYAAPVYAPPVPYGAPPYGGAPYGVAPYGVPSYANPAFPWQAVPSAAPPVVDRFTGSLKLGLILDAAAQALAAMASLPTPPPASGEGKADFTNLVKYQESLAVHAKRDEQIRTIGALARLFLV